MTTQSLPLLQYPFDEQHNQYEQDIETAISAWLDQYPFISDAERQYYKQCRFGMISSYFYPNASYEALLIGAKLVVLLFINDDHTDNISPEELRSILSQSESIMAGHDISHDRNSIFQEFVQLREDLQAFVPPEWMQRWNSNLNYFYEGMIMERYFMSANQYPSVQHYMFAREHLIGMYIYQDIVELYLPSLLPYEILSHPHTRQLRQVASRIIAWCNDYYSAAKELDAGQIMNLVLVIKQERQCSLEEAYAIAMHIHDEEIRKFRHLKKHIPDFGPYNEIFKTYIDELQLMFKGNHEWHITSGRYNKV